MMNRIRKIDFVKYFYSIKGTVKMDWALLSLFLTVAIAHFLALLSPAPDFILVVKSAINNGPKKSIGVAAILPFA